MRNRFLALFALIILGAGATMARNSAEATETARPIPMQSMTGQAFLAPAEVISATAGTLALQAIPADPVGTVRQIPMHNLSAQGVYVAPVERWGKPTDDPVWMVYDAYTETAVTTSSACPRNRGDIATLTGTAIGDWTEKSEGGRKIFSFTSTTTPKVVKIFFGRFQYDETHELHITDPGLHGYSVVTHSGTFRCIKSSNPEHRPPMPIGHITTTPPPTTGGGDVGSKSITEAAIKAMCVGNCDGIKLVTGNDGTPYVTVIYVDQCYTLRIPTWVTWDDGTEHVGTNQPELICSATLRLKT